MPPAGVAVAVPLDPAEAAVELVVIVNAAVVFRWPVVGFEWSGLRAGRYAWLGAASIHACDDRE